MVSLVLRPAGQLVQVASQGVLEVIHLKNSQRTSSRTEDQVTMKGSQQGQQEKPKGKTLLEQSI